MQVVVVNTCIKQRVPVTAQAVQKSQQCKNIQWGILYCDMSRQRWSDERFQCRHGAGCNSFRRCVAATCQLGVVCPTTFRFGLLWTDGAVRLSTSVRGCSKPETSSTQLCHCSWRCLQFHLSLHQIRSQWLYIKLTSHGHHHTRSQWTSVAETTHGHYRQLTAQSLHADISLTLRAILMFFAPWGDTLDQRGLNWAWRSRTLADSSKPNFISADVWTPKLQILPTFRNTNPMGAYPSGNGLPNFQRLWAAS